MSSIALFHIIVKANIKKHNITHYIYIVHKKRKSTHKRALV